MVKHLPAVQETQVWSLVWEDLVKKEMATHSSTLAWKIPWTEEPDRLQSMGLQRVRHDSATSYWGNGFPGGAIGKEPSCQCLRFKRHGFDPWVRKIPRRKKWQLHSSILAWRIPWTEESGVPWFIGSQRSGHDWSDLAHTYTEKKNCLS